MTSSPQSPPSSNVEFEIRCPLSGTSLAMIRCFVETVASEMGFSVEDAAKIEMAVDEACSNVLLHAYPASPQSPPDPCLTLKIKVESDAISIWIIDQGVGAVSGKHKGVESLSEYLKLEKNFHGLGTYIIYNFMDVVDYDFPEQCGTILRMVKYLKSQSQADSNDQAC